MNTREIEMIVCWSNRTWTNCHFVDIPADTPNDKLVEVGREILLAELSLESLESSEVVGIWLYNSQEKEENTTICECGADLTAAKSVRVHLSIADHEFDLLSSLTSEGTTVEPGFHGDVGVIQLGLHAGSYCVVCDDQVGEDGDY